MMITSAQSQGKSFGSYHFGVDLETERARLSKSKAERRRDKWRGKVKDRGGYTGPAIAIANYRDPFERIGMDVVGPLARESSSGNRYILVICDKNCLLQLFSRVDLPKEKKTYLMSKLLQWVYQLLRVNGIRITSL